MTKVKKPDFWCNICADTWDEDDVITERERDPYGTGDKWHVLVNYVCPACAHDVEEYKYQDEEEEQDDE